MLATHRAFKFAEAQCHDTKHPFAPRRPFGRINGIILDIMTDTAQGNPHGNQEKTHFCESRGSTALASRSLGRRKAHGRTKNDRPVSRARTGHTHACQESSSDWETNNFGCSTVKTIQGLSVFFATRTCWPLILGCCPSLSSFLCCHGPWEKRTSCLLRHIYLFSGMAAIEFVDDAQ